jgi:hypothetical protein
MDTEAASGQSTQSYTVQLLDYLIHQKKNLAPDCTQESTVSIFCYNLYQGSPEAIQ